MEALAGLSDQAVRLESLGPAAYGAQQDQMDRGSILRVHRQGRMDLQALLDLKVR